jgi:SCF-associated factor 1
VQLRMPGIRVVNLVAGGMSFHALDSNGNVHVWGTLNGLMFAADTQGFSNSGRKARTPHQLSLPVAIRGISCGRLHSSCLDRNNSIWTFTNWGRPFKLASAILRDAEFTPKQVECGWTFSSFLTKSGDVFAWWPSAGRMGEIVDQKMREMDDEGEKKAQASAQHVIPCVPWDMEEMPTRLPPIPSLPELPDAGNTSHSDDIQLIQIAAFDQHIIGLTNRGHVLKFGPLHNESGVEDARWEYLPNYSEVAKIREQPAFLESEDGNTVPAPTTMQITHITANFEHFIAYSTGASSIVLIGDISTTKNSQPKIIPELQHRSVISVVVGDYHNAAVTADGKLLTWGSFSHGALGLGDPVDLEPGTPGGFATERDRTFAARSRRGEPPAVDIPTEVRFDHHSKSARKRYCVSATAAGWHTGALVIDLEPGEEDHDSENETVNTESTDAVEPIPPTLPPHSWESPPFVPLPGIIRVGFAGRGGLLQRARRGGPLRRTQPRPPNEGDAS